ncbi:MAG: RICIN domain-containing protein, partial [Bacteroidaceae bacterium]
YTDNTASHLLTGTGTQSESTMYNYGMKLVGNYKWSLAEGESWASSNDGTWVTAKENSVGYVSPGHNSAYYDSQTGRYFLVFHTRFYRGWEGHAVRVHEMLMNQDGWPVLAPYRYAGERQKEVAFKASDYPGTYKFVMHDTPKDTLQATSTEIIFGEDGSVTGSVNFAATTKVTNKTVTGTWSVDALDPKKLTMDLRYGTSTTKYTYHCFFLYQPDCFTGADRICFTASRNNTLGAAIWGAKIDAGIPSFKVEDGALYRILNMNSGLWLEVAGSKRLSNIYLSNYDDSIAQVFRLNPVGDGYYQLQTKLSGYSMAVSIANAENVDGANITTINTTTVGNRTSFKLEDTGKGTFAILSAVSSDKRALNAFNGGVTEGTNVDQYSYSASSSTVERQQWVLYKVSNDDTPIETVNEDASSLEVFTLGRELKASLNLPGNIRVYDMQGRIVKSAVMVTELILTVSEPGAYFVVANPKGAVPIHKKILVY